MHLTSAAERTLESKRKELSKAVAPEELKPELPVLAEPQTPTKTLAEKRTGDRRQCRLERYNEVVELFRQGMTQRAISQKLHAKLRRKAPQVDKFRGYLEKRWAEGCHNATKLWREIQSQGHTGCRSMVARLVSTFRAPTTKHGHSSEQQSTPRAKCKSLSPKQATMLLARRPEKLPDAEQKLVARIQTCCPEAAILQPIMSDFSAVLRNKDAYALQPWMDRANAADLPAIKNFCDGLSRDRAAVMAAISLTWSNGQVEGQVHRLKLINGKCTAGQASNFCDLASCRTCH